MAQILSLQMCGASAQRALEKAEELAQHAFPAQVRGRRIEAASLAIGGGMLALLGMQRRSLQGVPLIAAGAGLAYLARRLWLKRRILGSLGEGTGRGFNEPHTAAVQRAVEEVITADRVAGGSYDSFPASDPPSWMGTT